MTSGAGGDGDPTAEVTDLLQHLIRNACVNDGSAESGQELRTVGVLDSYLGRTGLDLETYEAAPGRSSLVSRIEGSDPSAPTLMLMGHTDVVPVTPEHWQRDPFGGELVDGEVWGRGAVDMLNLTSSMAVAFRRLADEGFHPRGTLVYLAVADEEAMGEHGAQWLLANHPDAVACDYLVTESGGWRRQTGEGPRVTVNVAEKGSCWVRLRVEGTPGHASRPLRTDNALVKAAQVVQRIAEYRPPTRVTEVWSRYVDGLGLDPELTQSLQDPAQVWDVVQQLPSVPLAREAHACTHTTFAPTVVRGGTKTNVIPDRVTLDVDIRTVPGDSHADVEAMLTEAIGPELMASVAITGSVGENSTASAPDTPLWESLQRVTERLAPGAQLIPGLMTGATDSRFFRPRGVTAYGAGLFSDRIPAGRFSAMFHGNDERIDTESLRLSTELWMGLARDLLG